MGGGRGADGRPLVPPATRRPTAGDGSALPSGGGAAGSAEGGVVGAVGVSGKGMARRKCVCSGGLG